MIELFEGDRKEDNRRSSKGNQLKWKKGNIWYKADYLGYEGLSEFLCAKMLVHSGLDAAEFVSYDTEEISYKKSVMRGCSSADFLKEGERLVTLERLFSARYGRSLGAAVYGIPAIEDRVKFLAETVTQMTGIPDFGIYLNKILTIDALFLNEDRHTHNIAVICKEDDSFRLCPVFDHGASLLSDTTLDYPLGEDIYSLIDSVKAKTVCDSFADALEASEKLYGSNLKFSFDWHDIRAALEEDTIYPAELKARAEKVLLEQRRRYSYLF